MSEADPKRRNDAEQRSEVQDRYLAGYLKRRADDRGGINLSPAELLYIANVLLSTSAPQPVAWRWRFKDGDKWFLEHKQPANIDLDVVEPLYTSSRSETPRGDTAKADMPCEVRDMLDALKDYEQADERGVYVKVSRQAVDEAVELISARYGKEEK